MGRGQPHLCEGAGEVNLGLCDGDFVIHLVRVLFAVLVAWKHRSNELPQHRRENVRGCLFEQSYCDSLVLKSACLSVHGHYPRWKNSGCCPWRPPLWGDSADQRRTAWTFCLWTAPLLWWTSWPSTLDSVKKSIQARECYSDLYSIMILNTSDYIVWFPVI